MLIVNADCDCTSADYCRSKLLGDLDCWPLHSKWRATMLSNIFSCSRYSFHIWSTMRSWKDAHLGICKHVKWYAMVWTHYRVQTGWAWGHNWLWGTEEWFLTYWDRQPRSHCSPHLQSGRWRLGWIQWLRHSLVGQLIGPPVGIKPASPLSAAPSSRPLVLGTPLFHQAQALSTETPLLSNRHFFQARAVDAPTRTPYSLPALSRFTVS